MLKHLRIQNFAIIDEATITFGQGLNIISGETGAGKSILMDALMLILGGRASSDLIRRGSEEAAVEALFELDDCPETSRALEEQGLLQENELIIRRIVQASGKNRIFVNGSMVNISTLQSITSHLVDLCSQHDQQLLARAEEQLLWIDRFGNLESQREKVRALHGEWKAKKAALEALSTDSVQRAQRIDFLRFQLTELEEAALSSPTEDQDLERELKILGNAEELFAFSSEAEEFLYGSDLSEIPPTMDRLGTLINKAKTLSAADPKLHEALESLNTLKIHAEELGYFLRSYSQGVSRDEGRIESLNARLALLTKLKRKYGPLLSDVMANFETLQKELNTLENHDSSLGEAKDALEKAQSKFFSISEELSSLRAEAAKKFTRAVVGELSELHMDGAKFQASFQRLETPSASGVDSVRFEIAANPGEPMGALNKVASGGELSRIMLAMHNVVSSRGEVGVYLFDEVDTGIGGKTAVAVGAKLRRVARNNQVICITHLPQVAAHAHNHFHVEKSVKKREGQERTVASVTALSKEERILELARMLGGNEKDKAALANARAMIEKITAEKDQPVPKNKKPTQKLQARQ